MIATSVLIFFRHCVDLFLDFVNIFRKLLIILAQKVMADLECDEIFLFNSCQTESCEMVYVPEYEKC